MSTHPERIDQYELQTCLGRNGIEVWKAVDTQAHRTVAVTLRRGNLQTDPDFEAEMYNFQRNMPILVSLRHPNIVQYYDFSISHLPGAASDTMYFVTEYIEGETLATYNRNATHKGTLLPFPETIRLFSAIGLAVDYAHQQHVPHGDFKPTKILLDKRNTSHISIGEPLITDFGITRLLRHASGRASAQGNILSGMITPPYCSPEQITGKPDTVQGDIYSLGIMLYEICTGTLPFVGSNTIEIMMQQMNTIPASPSLINPNLPPALSAIIMRCLAKDPAARFPSASALVAALSDVLR